MQSRGIAPLIRDDARTRSPRSRRAPLGAGAAGRTPRRRAMARPASSSAACSPTGRPTTAAQLVTWAGSAWHCNETTTTKPGDGAKAWTLMVKRGRDGKDGKDGASGPEGPKGKDWQQVYDDTRRR